DRLRAALDLHGPFLALLVIRAALALGRGPIIELHDLRVHLEPVADLILGREHRPMLGKRQIGHVVVPDRVMQAERFVALAPLVARPLVLVDDEGRNAETLEPRSKPDAGLAAAHDQAIGLALVAKLRLLGRFAVEPGAPRLHGAMLDALLPRG